MMVCLRRGKEVMAETFIIDVVFVFLFRCLF